MTNYAAPLSVTQLYIQLTERHFREQNASLHTINACHAITSNIHQETATYYTNKVANGNVDNTRTEGQKSSTPLSVPTLLRIRNLRKMVLKTQPPIINPQKQVRSGWNTY